MKLLPLLCSLALFAPATASARDASIRRVAIVVGANGAAPGRKPLRFAHEDAKRMADVLRLAGFASSDIHVMNDPEPDALLGMLDRALRDMSPGKPSELVFYYSGHADTTSLYPSGKPLLLVKLRDRLESANATLRIGIIDACRGGGWTGAKGLAPAEPFEVDLPLKLSSEGSVLISASSGLEDAHESETLRGSFFTHHWIAALRGAADRDNDGSITLGEAFAYAKELTVRDTALQTKTPQHPSFQLNLRGKHELTLVTLAAASSVLTVQQDTGPLQLVHLDSGLVVLEGPRGKRRMKLALPPGKYVLRREADGKVFARELTVAAGKETRVDEEDLTLVGDNHLVAKGADDEDSSAYLAIGVGGGALTGTDREEFSSGVSWTIQLGHRVAPKVHILMNMDATSYTRYSLDSDYSQQQAAITFGALWSPSKRAYVKGGIGTAHLVRQEYGSFWSIDQGPWGGAVMAGLGYELFGGDTISAALEIADSLAIYGDGIRHNFGMNLVVSSGR
jgi:hypothetical protein